VKVPEQPWVVLDTDVWSFLFARRQTHTKVEHWRSTLLGRSVVIATQTRAEVLAGLAQRPLGQKRAAAITEQLDRTRTVPVTEAVVLAYAELAGACQRAGHALHDRVHCGDRWVAATAIAIGAPLLAGDGIYRNTPRLVLFDDPEDPYRR